MYFIAWNNLNMKKCRYIFCDKTYFHQYHQQQQFKICELENKYCLNNNNNMKKKMYLLHNDEHILA